MNQSSPIPLNHKPKRDLGKPAFDLDATKRMALKCVTNGYEGTLDHLINDFCCDDNGIYFKHDADLSKKD